MADGLSNREIAERLFVSADHGDLLPLLSRDLGDSLLQLHAGLRGQVWRAHDRTGPRIGAGPEKIEETRRQMESFKQMYSNPLINAAMTFIEPFPIGLIVSFLTAAILRKKQPA